MSDDPLTDCPVCEGSIRRVVNSVGVVFKGSGFYITDNRNGSTATLPSKDKTPAAADSGEKTAASSADEAKPKPAESKTAETKKAEASA